MPTSKLMLVAPATCRKYLVDHSQCKLTSKLQSRHAS